MSWRNLVEGKLTFEGFMKLIKGCIEEGEHILIIFLLALGILERFFLSISQWVFTLLPCEPISRELDSFPSWLMERKFITIIGFEWIIFIYRLKVHTFLDSIYLPLLSFLLHHSPYSHVMVHLLEWCLCLAESIWCLSLGIWCMDMYSHVNIIWNS